MSALSEAVAALEKAKEFRQALGKIDESIHYKVSINMGSGMDHICEGKYLRMGLIEALDNEIRFHTNTIDSIIHPKHED